MKKIFYAQFFLFLFSLHQSKAQNALDSGLVSYYPFNGNDSDNSVSGNHPIINTATLTADRFGNPNGAYSFNGVNSYMRISNNPSINFNKAMSICLWMKPNGYYTGLCYNNILMCKGVTDNSPGNAGNYSVRFADYVNGCNSLKDSTQEFLWGPDGVPATNQNIQTNRWYFVVYTTDGINSSLYINNKLCHTVNLPAGLTFTNNYDLFIGTMNNISYPYWFKGVMDDIRIYYRGLSRSEVNSLYNICPYPTIKGNVFVDVNANGIMDSTDYYKPNARINGSNGTFSISGVNGDYEIITDTVGIYGTNIIQPNFYTATPQSYSYNINSFDTTIISDYTLQNASQPFDSLSSYIIPLFGAARPGFSYPVGVTYTNEGNALLNSSLRISYDSNKLHFNSTTYVSLIDSGKFLLIPASNLLPGQRVSFMIDFTVKSNAVLGDTIKLVSTVNTLTVSCIDSVQTRIVGSFDPNDIQATESLTTVQVAQSKPIKYIIRFENTGTDTAFNVVIKDQLSNLLNKNSIELISSSHSCKISVKGSIVSFTFNNINLPDSNKNKIACHGYIAFYIKPVSTVSAGVDINNSAAIYFDYNKAVLTNTALTKIKNPFITPLKFISYELKSLNENNSKGNTQTVVNLWKTANEMNVHHFNVQRSFNGKDFINVGEVIALNKINNDYSFIDVVANNLLSPIIYYRLQAIDKDGSKTYSSIKTIIFIYQDLSIQVYPNPAMDQISIQRKTDKIETVSIIDIDGKIVKTIQLNKFLQIISIKELQNGIYLLKFEHSEMIKLIKQ